MDAELKQEIENLKTQLSQIKDVLFQLQLELKQNLMYTQSIMSDVSDIRNSA